MYLIVYVYSFRVGPSFFYFILSFALASLAHSFDHIVIKCIFVISSFEFLFAFSPLHLSFITNLSFHQSVSLIFLMKVYISIYKYYNFNKLVFPENCSKEIMNINLLIWITFYSILSNQYLLIFINLLYKLWIFFPFIIRKYYKI